MRKHRRFVLEQLEDRLVPSSSHPLWPDAAHLTLSFVPDGTDVGGSPSGLFATLNAAAPAANWETEILRAFQTWAVNSNINIGVVPDGGQPLGCSGAVQGDPRFGDIRVAAKALPGGTVATTAFFSWTGSTWNGDLILNSNYNFGIAGAGQYDLYTVALHEAGHVFGFDDQTSDPTSVMYEAYTGPRTSLSSQDIANLQARYGDPQPDSFNSQNADNSFSSAALLGNGYSKLVPTMADLVTPAQVEYYQFSTPGNPDFTGFTFSLKTSGISLLVPSLTIYNAAQQPIASAVASGPLNGDLTLTVSAVRSTTYYVKVAGAANDVFGIGAYQFNISYDFVAEVPPAPAPTPLYTFVNNFDKNNTTGNAIDLNNKNNNLTGIPANSLYRETVDLSTDRDFFKVKAPSTNGIGSYTLSAIAWGAGLVPLYPIIHVYDSKGNPLAVEVLTNSGGTYAVQVANTSPNSHYYVEVDPLQPGTLLNSTGNYSIYVNFSTVPPEALTTLGSNTLSQANVQETATLVVNQNQLFHFVLAASSASTDTYVTMTVSDQNGNTILTLNSFAGQPPSTAMVYLPAGTYTVTYTARSQSGGQVAPITYWLLGEDLSDPQGPYYTSGSPGGNNCGGGVTYGGPTKPGPRPYYY